MVDNAVFIGYNTFIHFQPKGFSKMPDKKTLGMLLGDSLGIFKDNMAKMIQVVLIAYIPLEVLIVVLVLAISGQAGDAGTFNVSRFLLSLVFLVVTIGISLLYQVAVVKTVESVDKKQPLEPLALYKTALADMGGYLVVALWVMVKVLLWSLLLVIPGVIFGILYSFATFAFLLDRKKGIEALQFSRGIIRANVWRFIGNSLAVGLITGSIYFVIKIILALIFGVPAQSNPTLLSLTGQGLGNIFNAVIGVYVFIFYYLLYGEFKKTAVTI